MNVNLVVNKSEYVYLPTELLLRLLNAAGAIQLSDLDEGERELRLEMRLNPKCVTKVEDGSMWYRGPLPEMALFFPQVEKSEQKPIRVL